MKRNRQLVAQALTQSLLLPTWIMQNITFSYAEKKQSMYTRIFKEFAGRCPSDGSELMKIEEMPPVKCPRCNQAILIMERNRPMEDSSTTPTYMIMSDQLND